MAQRAASQGTGQPSGDNAGFMKGLVIVLGVLLIAGFVALFSIIVYRMVKLDRSGATTGTGVAADLDVPSGAQVRGFEIDGNRLAVHLVTGDGSEEIVILDVRRGDVVSRFKLKPGS